MKILLLCKKFPYPTKDGESIAVHTLSKALSEQGCELSMLAMNTSKHRFKAEKYPKEADHLRRIRTVPVDNRVKKIPAFLNLFSSKSYHIDRFVSPVYADTLRQMLTEEKYDIVQLETLYLTPYIPIIRKYAPNARISMRSHNVEHEIWERITSNTSFAPKRWYLRHLTHKLYRYEQSAMQDFDLMLAITERDLRRFRALGYQKPAVVTPIGLAPDQFCPAQDAPHPQLSVSFIGSLDWMPNLEGLEWFIKKAWPLIEARYPNLKLHIAGRNTPKSLYKLNSPHIEVHGEVPCSSTFIHQHEIMVVPLLSGSGMRAKILEGMALGKTVITTSIGLEGIEARDREEVLIADDPQAFVEAFAFALDTKGRLQDIGERGRRFVYDAYDSGRIAKRVVDLYTAQLMEIV